MFIFIDKSLKVRECRIPQKKIFVQKISFTFPQTQKEILDTELDIIAKQNEGEDTSELRKKVAELKREVKRILNALLETPTNHRGHFPFET